MTDYTPLILAMSGIITVLIGAIGLMIRSFIKGQIVPRSHVEDVRQDRKERVTELANERDTWRAAFDTLNGTVQTLVQQGDQLLSHSALTNQLLTAWKERVEK